MKALQLATTYYFFFVLYFYNISLFSNMEIARALVK